MQNRARNNAAWMGSAVNPEELQVDFLPWGSLGQLGSAVPSLHFSGHLSLGRLNLPHPQLPLQGWRKSLWCSYTAPCWFIRVIPGLLLGRVPSPGSARMFVMRGLVSGDAHSDWRFRSGGERQNYSPEPTGVGADQPQQACGTREDGAFPAVVSKVFTGHFLAFPWLNTVTERCWCSWRSFHCILSSSTAATAALLSADRRCAGSRAATTSSHRSLCSSQPSVAPSHPHSLHLCTFTAQLWPFRTSSHPSPGLLSCWEPGAWTATLKQLLKGRESLNSASCVLSPVSCVLQCASLRMALGWRGNEWASPAGAGLPGVSWLLQVHIDFQGKDSLCLLAAGSRRLQQPLPHPVSTHPQPRSPAPWCWPQIPPCTCRSVQAPTKTIG